MHGRGRRRQRRYRKRGEELALEEAFADVWAQRAWAPHRHETPLGIVFPATSEWRSWLVRVHARFGDVEVLTVSACEPAVAVFFVGPDGQWLDAVTIEDLIALAYSGHAERGHRTMEAVRSMQPASGSHRISETEQCPCQVCVRLTHQHERDAHAPV